MNFKDYQEASARTVVKKSQSEMLMEFSLGIAGEAGEVIDQIKKHLYHGHSIDEEKIIEELGDLLWYICQMSDLFSFDLSSVAYYNIKKLEKRYPKGFSTVDSLKRIDTKDKE